MKVEATEWRAVEVASATALAAKLNELCRYLPAEHDCSATEEWQDADQGVVEMPAGAWRLCEIIARRGGGYMLLLTRPRRTDIDE